MLLKKKKTQGTKSKINRSGGLKSNPGFRSCSLSYRARWDLGLSLNLSLMWLSILVIRWNSEVSMKRFVKVFHRHLRASFMYCVTAETHRSKMTFLVGWFKTQWKPIWCPKLNLDCGILTDCESEDGGRER